MQGTFAVNCGSVTGVHVVQREGAPHVFVLASVTPDPTSLSDDTCTFIGDAFAGAVGDVDRDGTEDLMYCRIGDPTPYFDSL